MRKMKLMTSYNDLVQDKVHKNFLTKKTGTEYNSIKVVPIFAKYRLFFFSPHQNNSARGKERSYKKSLIHYLIPIHSPNIVQPAD